MNEPRAATVLDPASVEQIEMLERFKPGSRQQLAELFQASFARDLAAGREALERGDALRLRQAAHSIKGSSAGLGATTLSQHAAAMERAAANGELDAARAALDGVERAFADAWVVLGTWLAAAAPQD
jgi:HPt (histidine-containing phosphotransfer) domain-containing protein